MIRFSIILFLLIIITVSAHSQQDTSVNSYYLPATIEKGDTTYQFNFEPVVIVPEREFKNNKDKERYGRLIYNVKKVYPFAKEAKKRLEEINTNLGKIKNEKERKNYLKIAEKQMFDEFTDDIENMSFSQGKILLKLIDRETGSTTYTIIKQYKGSFSAVFWQGIARMFSANLKTEYDMDGEDKMIGEIVFKIENGQL